MSGVRHASLIHFSLDLVGGIEKVKNMLSGLCEYGNVVSTSSAYKRYLTLEQNDLSARIEIVVKFETLYGVDQILHFVTSLNDDTQVGIRRQSYARINLLTFDDLILMSPRLTLPYPDLHQDPLVIRCAAEAWGQYEHPIYEKNLSEMSKIAPPALQAEFLMQGKSLVDF